MRSEKKADTDVDSQKVHEIGRNSKDEIMSFNAA